MTNIAITIKALQCLIEQCKQALHVSEDPNLRRELKQDLQEAQEQLALEQGDNDDEDEDGERTHQCPECGYETPGCGCPQFADPTGHSALRAASRTNPRNRRCPTCGKPNRLTPEDVALGYQCDECADRMERGGDY